MNSPKRSLNRNQVEIQFDRAAATYDRVADLQRRMGDQLLKRVCESVADRSAPLIDLGCGTGALLGSLSNAGFTRLSGLDISANMLDLAKAKAPLATLIHGDIEQIPCNDQSFQTVVSNAALQWCNSGRAFAELHRILEPGGTVFANIFVAGTLAQWSRAFSSVTDESRVHALSKTDDVRLSISESNFHELAFTQRKETAKFSSVELMLNSIRKLGATNATVSRSKPISRQNYETLKSYFQRKLADRGWLELDFVWSEIVLKK